ncbi:hypothetical protein [Bacillus seohaeanensis]|uniref:Integrase catalytic domain-containing protein n=1 Tax=Bacillus seohaeanensis TaxID=284580 RepID=A0ABW5RM74_9BACI
MMLEDAKYIEILEFILKGRPYREIADSLKVSKNTITDLIKRLRNTGSIFPSTTKKSIYDPIIKEIQEHVVQLLRMRRSTYNLRHKIKLTNTEIYLLILAKGYKISFTKVKELIKFGKNIIKEGYLNIIHLPGDAVEFDWGTLQLQIEDEENATRVSLAVFSFPYSNFRKAYVLPNASGESFVIAFKKFIKDMHGVPRLFILDNMRIARKLSSTSDNEVKLTTLFKDLSKHYQFNVTFCAPHCPNQKGNVENNVGILKKHFEQSYIHSFNTIDEVQEYVDRIIGDLNVKKHPRKNDTCDNLINHERKYLLPLPKKEFIFFHQKECTVSNHGTITFQKNHYTVPEMFKREKVLVKYNDKVIYIFKKGTDTVIAKYSPITNKGKRKHRIWYMINKLKNKGNGFIDSEEYKSMPKQEKLILEKVFKNNSHEFLAFIKIIKDRPRDIIRKFVYKYKDTLEGWTVNQLMEEIQVI